MVSFCSTISQTTIRCNFLTWPSKVPVSPNTLMWFVSFMILSCSAKRSIYPHSLVHFPFFLYFSLACFSPLSPFLGPVLLFVLWHLCICDLLCCVLLRLDRSIVQHTRLGLGAGPLVCLAVLFGKHTQILLLLFSPEWFNLSSYLLLE